uniref:Secreted protein n=1 Tax=Magallana gigas TaxID=29159 RepID=K1R6V9_MAGGI
MAEWPLMLYFILTLRAFLTGKIAVSWKSHLEIPDIPSPTWTLSNMKKTFRVKLVYPGLNVTQAGMTAHLRNSTGINVNASGDDRTLAPTTQPNTSRDDRTLALERPQHQQG